MKKKWRIGEREDILSNLMTSLLWGIFDAFDESLMSSCRVVRPPDGRSRTIPPPPPRGAPRSLSCQGSGTTSTPFFIPFQLNFNFNNPFRYGYDASSFWSSGHRVTTLASVSALVRALWSPRGGGASRLVLSKRLIRSVDASDQQSNKWAAALPAFWVSEWWKCFSFSFWQKNGKMD